MTTSSDLATSKYRTDAEIVHLLEEFRWKRKWPTEWVDPRKPATSKSRKPIPPSVPPICPYCASNKFTPAIRTGRHLNKHFSKHRYHCNSCNKSYCVTVGTAFHKTHISLRKWFRIIELSTQSPPLSIMRIARAVRVAKNTAHRALIAIRSDDALMAKTVEWIKQLTKPGAYLIR